MINHNLISKAKKARKNALARYSGFFVGAALQTQNGKIFTGVNIESSSYGLTICAERVALFKALSEGEKLITEIAVVADSIEPVSPCGACRQIMIDYATQAIVYLANLNNKVKKISVLDLLPYPFSKKNLDNNV